MGPRIQRNPAEFANGRVAVECQGALLTHLTFNSNKTISIGVEVELQLVDPSTGDLIPVGKQVLEGVTGEASARVKSEIFQSMLEIDTPICADAHEAGASLRSSLAAVAKVANENGVQVMMAGTHPFAKYTERLLTPEGRYFSLVDRNQWISRRLQIFGLHVHLGMRDGDHAIAMNNALCHYLPILLALSASSPYWHSEDTGLASSRITFFEAIPTGGHPYLLRNWAEFEDLVHKLTVSRSIISLKDLWWDIRPSVGYGTIEIRIADCPPTIREVEAIVALLHMLAEFIDAEILSGRKFAPPPEWILRENKWRASRHGVNADLIVNAEGLSVPFPEVWRDLCKSLSPQITRFGYQRQTEFLQMLIQRGPSYQRQRRHASSDLRDVVKHLIRENKNDLPEWDEAK